MTAYRSLNRRQMGRLSVSTSSVSTWRYSSSIAYNAFGTILRFRIQLSTSVGLFDQQSGLLHPCLPHRLHHHDPSRANSVEHLALVHTASSSQAMQLGKQELYKEMETLVLQNTILCVDQVATVDIPISRDALIIFVAWA
jgi:hypothetical protein